MRTEKEGICGLVWVWRRGSGVEWGKWREREKEGIASKVAEGHVFRDVTLPHSPSAPWQSAVKSQNI